MKSKDKERERDKGGNISGVRYRREEEEKRLDYFNEREGRNVSIA